MNETRRSELAPFFSHTALGCVLALAAIACGEDDGSTGTVSNLGAAGRTTMTPPATTPPATTPPATTPPAMTPTATTPPPTMTPPASPPATTPAPAPALPAGTYAVCERPESAFFDAGSNAWYVSCMIKGDVPGDGYVKKLNADATEVITEKFVTGLNEPKGIRVSDGKLYVSDVNALVTADLATGATLATTSIVGIDPRVPAQSSLNDVTVDPANGNVYVSDQRNDLLYRFDLDGGSPEILIAGPVLEGPNGLLIDDRNAAAPRLLIASLGPGLNPMLGVTEKLGAVIAIDIADLLDGNDTVQTTYVSQRIGNLDGIERFGDDLLVSDYFAGRVLRLTPTQAAPVGDEGDGQIIRQSLGNSADLGINTETGVIMVPETAKGTLVSIELAP